MMMFEPSWPLYTDISTKKNRRFQMSILTNLSGDLAAITEFAGRSVVSIARRRNVSASGIIWSDDGLIVTVHHAVEDEENIRIAFGDGKTAEGSLVGRDPTTDLALIRVSTKPENKASWSDSDQLRVGHLVLALGRPGRTIRAALGIVSVYGEGWQTGTGGIISRYIQTDASSFPGFSGGPLVDMEGRVIGINTSGLIRNTTVTIPAVTIQQVVDELLKSGHISRGYLGVTIQPARLPPELSQQLGQETGLLVMSVESGSSAEQAGIVYGDTIVSISGEVIRNWDDLHAALSKDKIGVKVPVRIIRAGKLQELQTIVSEHP
jgi:S1-C subfamily serine protease